MPAIRRHVRIASTTRNVWRAISTPEGLAGWLCDEARIEPRMGGRFVLLSKDDNGTNSEDRGLVHTWRPASHLEMAFDRQSQSVHASTRVSFQVALDGDEVRVSIVVSGEPLDDNERTEVIDVQWRQALAALQASLDAPSV
jgi:uncharacterized protein YndB with AHSA1/START domain